MPTKQLRRRHVATGVCDKTFAQHGSDTVDRLAFKYTEMCKVDSSSDSESDTSPRWSDANSKSLQGCTGLKMSNLPQKPFGRHCPKSLDPYDGSSEDSASSAGDPKRQKRDGFKVKERGNRATNSAPLPAARKLGPRDDVTIVHLTDVQMRSSSDSEVKSINQGDFPYNPKIPEKLPLYPTPFGKEPSFQLTDGFLKSSTLPGTLLKRKLFCPLGEECIHRKKKCITQKETKTIFPES